MNFWRSATFSNSIHCKLKLMLQSFLDKNVIFYLMQMTFLPLSIVNSWNIFGLKGVGCPLRWKIIRTFWDSWTALKLNTGHATIGMTDGALMTTEIWEFRAIKRYHVDEFDHWDIAAVHAWAYRLNRRASSLFSKCCSADLCRTLSHSPSTFLFFPIQNSSFSFSIFTFSDCSIFLLQS